MSDSYGEILFAWRYRHSALVYPWAPASGKRNDSSYLLPKYDAEAATPVFCQADPHNFQLWRQHAQEPVGCGVEPQRRSHQIDDGWRCLQLNAGEITVPTQVALIQMTPNAEPVIRSLQRQTQKFRRLEFENRKPAAARNSQDIEDAVVATGVCQDLCVSESLIERRVHTRHIFPNQSFHPSFRLRAKKRMHSVRCQRVTVRRQIVEQLLQHTVGRRG